METGVKLQTVQGTLIIYFHVKLHRATWCEVIIRMCQESDSVSFTVKWGF